VRPEPNKKSRPRKDNFLKTFSTQIAKQQPDSRPLNHPPKTLLQKLVDTVQLWPIAKLIPYARNARTHSEEHVAQVAASIREFGFLNPILVDSQGGVIAGHCRLLAALKLGLAEVPVIVLDHLTDTQKRAYILADNRLAEAADWDEEMLAVELAALAEQNFVLDLTGFDDSDLRRLLDQHSVPDGRTEEDAVPETADEVVSRRGDLWIMGDHRLLCGDSILAVDVRALMGADKAQLVASDPPYNVDYVGHTEDRLTIAGDRMTEAEFQQFLAVVFAHYRELIRNDGSLYVFHPSSWQREFQVAMEAAGFQIRCQIIWAKNTFAWGFGRYKFQHEPLFYAHVAGERDQWYGDKSQSTLWNVDKPAANRVHPTMKPVELIDRALINSSKQGDIVADLFGGSGSTLIACERRGRKARLMEIDPKYCDVIVRRWQDHTGKKAVLDGSDKAFEDIENARRSTCKAVNPEPGPASGLSHTDSAEIQEAA
jgi:DNA modification methylase